MVVNRRHTENKHRKKHKQKQKNTKNKQTSTQNNIFDRRSRNIISYDDEQNYIVTAINGFTEHEVPVATYQAFLEVLLGLKPGFLFCFCFIFGLLFFLFFLIFCLFSIFFLIFF